MTIIATRNIRNGTIDRPSIHKVSAQKANAIIDWLNIYDTQRERNHRWNVVDLEGYTPRVQKNIIEIAEAQSFVIRDGQLIEQKNWGTI